MTPSKLETEMLRAEVIANEDPEVALKYANRMIAEALVDLGYSEAVVIYKSIIDTYGG